MARRLSRMRAAARASGLAALLAAALAATAAQAASPHAAGPLKNAVDEVLADVKSHTSLCALVHAVRATPCASHAMLQKLIPQLLPIEVSNVAFRKRDRAELERMARAGRTTPPPPELERMAHDMDVSLKITHLSVASANDISSAGVSGRVEMDVHTPQNAAIKRTQATLNFVGAARLTYAPDAATCKSKGGDSVRVYAKIKFVKFTIEKLSTERSWWAKLFPTDGLVTWIVNHVLTHATHALLGADAVATVGADPQDGSLGFPLCLGKKDSCGGTIAKKPATTFVAARINIGRFGAIDFAKAGSAKPFVSLGSPRILCEAFDTITSTPACTRPLFDAVLKTVLPMTVAVPKDLVKLAARGDPNAGALALNIASVAIDVTDKPGAQADVAATVKASLGDPANRANTPLELSARADVSLGAVCSEDSVYVWKKLQLGALAASSAIPKWLSDGLGRTAINTHLRPIDVCVDPLRIAALDRTVDVCSLGKDLLEMKATGAAADAALATLLPLSVQPKKFLKPTAKPSIQQAFDGITVSLTNAALATGKGPDTLNAQIAVTKAGQADKLEAKATVAIGLETKCGPKGGVLRFAPNVTELSVTKVPPWLLQTTLLELINGALAKKPPVSCIWGACKNKPTMAVRSIPLAQPAMDAVHHCSFEEGGRR